MNHIIFDIEVFAHDWVVVFKPVEGGPIYAVFHNDLDGLKEWLEQRKYNSIFFGANIKHYDNHILRGILGGLSTTEIKQLNDYIIGGNEGWSSPLLQGCKGTGLNTCDLFDDLQEGLSLKAIEAHLGMRIEESEVDFDIDRPLTQEELSQTIYYCKYDVYATGRLYGLRKDYLDNKVYLGAKAGLSEAQALYMTNAKLTAAYLKAEAHQYNDERMYCFPTNVLFEYIPKQVIEFFERMHDETLTDEEVFSGKLQLNIGECEVTLGFGGIHGSIDNYREEATETRTIRNQDVASYYPHLMVIDGYCSRSIPDPRMYANMLAERIAAKRKGDKKTANALKLVANTTYGAMLNPYNPLYDPLMGRSVCVTGQLRLLELAMHLVAACPTLKIIQLNTDGIMVSLDNSDTDTYLSICKEWQDRTGFTLEEDCIKAIIQKDVNNYVEIATDGHAKIKGGMLVRGIAPAGAFNINNNAVVVARALVEYFAHGTPVEDTINSCDRLQDFQMIAKASSKYKAVYHIVANERVPVQRCNRVYASRSWMDGTLIKIHKNGTEAKIGGLPTRCVIDNTNGLTLDAVDREWYINLARDQVNAFLGITPPKKNNRKLNSLVRDCLKLFS